MKPNDAVIQVSDLSLYIDTTILDHIDLSIPRGAVVGLVGRNGAGKSTLLRCMVGLAEPTQGAAKLLGCPALDLSDPVRERLGYVAQTPDLFEWMEVHEHLRAIGQAYPRWNEERCLVLACRLGLPMGGRVKNLSVGDQQKLAVVLALAHDPDVLLLDEPVSNLDPMTRNEFMRSLFVDRRLGEETDERGVLDAERTIVISSHLLSDLERVVSHVAFIRQGRLQLFEAWDAMLEHFRLIPQPGSDLPRAAVVCQNVAAAQCVIDTRLAPVWADKGRALSLDELFMELNS
ncbi:MAG: ABC transporter ATP-binding protein [Betaproteobacteria bacterium]